MTCPFLASVNKKGFKLAKKKSTYPLFCSQNQTPTRYFKVWTTCLLIFIIPTSSEILLFWVCLRRWKLLWESILREVTRAISLLRPDYRNPPSQMIQNVYPITSSLPLLQLELQLKASDILLPMAHVTHRSKQQAWKPTFYHLPVIV